ncbi:MAG TPA: serine/threonine-protein kinase [Burkholderiaceae bacterium]|nr:serine/threonine-protein kinase [Burkholderiaceae bacterium]
MASLIGPAVALLLAAAYLAWALPRLARWGQPVSAGLAGVALLAAWVAGVPAFAWFGMAVGFGQVGRWLALREQQAGATATADSQPASAGSTMADSQASSGASTRGERTTLGRYRIDREIGRGAMGMVYLGHDPQLGRQVAIKTMALAREFEGAELVEARARFFREAEMAGRLQHRDIVTIYDAGEDQELAYIAMEFVKGRDLLQHTLPGRLLPVAAVLETMARVAQALAYAHTQGVVHRDIKPANVMIDPDSDTVKVTDFGIARITDASRTRTGMVLGTPSFMSPEQMAGRRVDGRSDLYSLGVMLFQLLTGALPHASESTATLMYQIANQPAPDVRTLRPGLPEALANVVALALEKRPEVRYSDGKTLAADLLAVAAGMATRSADSAAAAPVSGASAATESGAFEETVKLSPADPRHNPDH